MRALGARIGVACLLALLCAGCPWPRTHPDDQKRCDPACGDKWTCKEGTCVRVTYDLGGPDFGQADGPVSCPSRPPRPELQLPTTTNHTKIALKGTAKGAVKVTVTGPTTRLRRRRCPRAASASC